MSLARWEERLAPLDGIVAVVLWVAGVIILQGPADQPDSSASAAEALAFFADNEGAILLGTFVYSLGTLFFLWFLGLVRSQLVAAEGGTHRLSSIAFAGGVATAISQLLMPGLHAAGAVNNENLSPEAAQAYLGIGDAFFLAAELSAAVFLLALGLVSLAAGAFPKWLAWVSMVVALWLVILPIGWAALLLAFPLWLIVVSLILWTRSRSDSGPGPERRAP